MEALPDLLSDSTDNHILATALEIKEQGTHNELAAMEEGIYAKLLNKQTQLQSVIAITG